MGQANNGWLFIKACSGFVVMWREVKLSLRGYQVRIDGETRCDNRYKFLNGEFMSLDLAMILYTKGPRCIKNTLFPLITITLWPNCVRPLSSQPRVLKTKLPHYTTGSLTWLEHGQSEFPVNSQPYGNHARTDLTSARLIGNRNLPVFSGTIFLLADASRDVTHRHNLWRQHQPLTGQGGILITWWKEQGHACSTIFWGSWWKGQIQ